MSETRVRLPTASRASVSTWTDVAQLVSVLRRRWDSGQYLRAYAASVPWVEISLSVKGPTATELLDHFEEARQWALDFVRDARFGEDCERFSIDYRTIRGRNLGANRVPSRIRVQTFEQLCALLTTSGDVRALDGLVAHSKGRIPAALPWIVDHPLKALEYRNVWDKVISIVEWTQANDPRGLFLRQLDVEGVDTKFVERHQKLLDELLTVALPPERVDLLYSRKDFTRRFGFHAKPSYTRFRVLDPGISNFPPGITELTLRTEELADLALGAATVFVVENEVTYLAFPALPESIVVFGSGFALAGLTDLPWLHHKSVVYWGDIDTHGFSILNRLRSKFGNVQSILMDHQTLLAHTQQWVTEPNPTRRVLQRLTEPEASLYRALVEGQYGSAVRLEQERVRFSLLQRSLSALDVDKATGKSIPS